IYIALSLLVFGILGYFFYFCKLPPIKQMNIKLQVPYIRKITQMLNTHYFSYQLGTLLQAGLSISEACVLMIKQEHYPFFQEESKVIQQLLKQGNELDKIIQTRRYYESQFSYIISHGLVNGNLDKELCDY